MKKTLTNPNNAEVNVALIHPANLNQFCDSTNSIDRNFMH
jgi:hypothetical protein